jgi:hypothetical protein
LADAAATASRSERAAAPGARGCLPPGGRNLGHAFAGKPGPRADGLSRRAPGRAHPAHRLTEERQRPCRRYGPATTVATANPWGRAAAGCAMAVRRQGAAGAATFESGGPQRRSFCAAGGWRNPMALLVAAGAVCRFGRRTIRRTWGSLGDPEVPVNRAWVPKSHPAIGKNCSRRADEPAEIHRRGP